MRYEWWIASRYIWSKRRHPFVGVISTISTIGICVGVAALIVVLAVMNGFDEDLKDRIIGTHAHLVIEKEQLFDNYTAVIAKVKKLKGVHGAAAYVEGQALVQKGELVAGVLVRGVDVLEERQVSKIFSYMKEGRLTDAPLSLVVGSEMARRFKLQIGSEISMLSQTTVKPIVFRVEGIFSSGMYEYDANLVFTNIKSSQKLFGYHENVSGVAIALKDAEKADKIKEELQKSFGYPYYVRTWMDMNKTLFGALKLEKIVMFLILALIIFVACLNIAGSLTILVMDKTKDIGILKALGATSVSCMKIFAVDGIFIGFIGSGAGFLLGMGICLLLKNYSFVELPKEIYYLDRLPVQINSFDTVKVPLVAMVLSFLSALYPAWVAGRLETVKALRYE